jgi:hypothetical protein
VVGAPGGAGGDPAVTVDATSSIELGRGRLIVHLGSAAGVAGAEQAVLQALAATGRDPALDAAMARYLNRQWTQIAGRIQHRYFLDSVVVAAAKAPGQAVRLHFTKLPR